MSTQRSLKQSKETYLNQYESEMKYLHNNPDNQYLKSEIKINNQFRVHSVQFKNSQNIQINE